MSSEIFTRIRCEGTTCGVTYPEHPTNFNTINGLRQLAREMGWKCYALHGKTFKDMCPKCIPARIKRTGNNGNGRKKL